jgi:hypothetical protein
MFTILMLWVIKHKIISSTTTIHIWVEIIIYKKKKKKKKKINHYVNSLSHIKIISNASVIR